MAQSLPDFMAADNPPPDPREQAVLPRVLTFPDPALLVDAGITVYVQALQACLRGDERMADRCAACDLPRAWHFDSSQTLMLGCGFAERVSQRPELRSRGSGSVLPLNREPTVSRKVFEALRSGRCGGPLSAVFSGCTHDELLVLARELTNTVIAAQTALEGDDAR